MGEKGEQFENRESREGEFIKPFELREGEEAVLRFAKKEDEQGLVEVDEDVARYRLKTYKMEKYAELLEKGEVGTWTKESLQKSLDEPDQSSIIVAESGDDITGYVGLEHYPEQGEGTVRFSNMYVKEKYHRQGIGTELVETALEKAKELYGAKKVALNTGEWNKPAKELYESQGFEQEGAPWASTDQDTGKEIMIYDPDQKKKIVAKVIRMVKELE